jgi:hypothetical protein
VKFDMSITKPLTMESLQQIIDIIERDKITITGTCLIEENNIVVLDHEKMRTEGCYTGKRGKEILCNPKHEELIKKELNL